MSFFSLYNRFLFSENEIINFPVNMENLKFHKVYDNKSNSTINALINKKTNFIYKLDLTDLNIKQINLSYELGKICFFTFFKNMIEAPLMILKEIVQTVFKIYEDYREIQFPFALGASIFRVLHAISRVINISFYMTHMQIAAMQGFLFNPATGFSKCSLLIEKMTNYNPNKNKTLCRPESLESEMYLRYTEIKLFNYGNLNDTFQNYNLDQKKRFEVIEVISMEIKNVPEIFPLKSYLEYKLIEVVKRIKNNLQKLFHTNTY